MIESDQCVQYEKACVIFAWVSTQVPAPSPSREKPALSSVEGAGMRGGYKYMILFSSPPTLSSKGAKSICNSLY
jgi:hypothetical protein